MRSRLFTGFCLRSVFQFIRKLKRKWSSLIFSSDEIGFQEKLINISISGGFKNVKVEPVILCQ